MLPTAHTKAQTAGALSQGRLLGGVCTGHLTPDLFAVHVTELGLRVCMAATSDTRRAGSQLARQHGAGWGSRVKWEREHREQELQGERPEGGALWAVKADFLRGVKRESG